jgi:hypothetical protein
VKRGRIKERRRQMEYDRRKCQRVATFVPQKVLRKPAESRRLAVTDVLLLLCTA